MELHLHHRIDQSAHHHPSVAARRQSERGNNRDAFIGFHHGNLRVQQVDTNTGARHACLRQMLVHDLLYRAVRLQRDQLLSLESGPGDGSSSKCGILISGVLPSKENEEMGCAECQARAQRYPNPCRVCPPEPSEGWRAIASPGAGWGRCSGSNVHVAPGIAGRGTDAGQFRTASRSFD